MKRSEIQTSNFETNFDEIFDEIVVEAVRSIKNKFFIREKKKNFSTQRILPILKFSQNFTKF
jgi:hypothetical protein